AQQPSEYFQGDAGETLDPAAITAYQVRLEELVDGLREAGERGEQQLQEALHRESEQLRTALETAVDLRGRARKAGNNRERVRNAASNAIRRALAEIKESSLALWAHLQPPRLSLGNSMRYHTSPKVAWAMEFRRDDATLHAM